MTRLEAEGAIQNAREAGYTLQWNQTHTKRGKSGPRYEKYKAYKTFDDVDAAGATLQISNQLLSFFLGFPTSYYLQLKLSV